MDLKISAKKLSRRFISIRINNGEKSRPPAEGIYFLTGESVLRDISSTSSIKGFDFSGDTQLKITPPITPKKIILSIIIRVCIIATPTKVKVSY